MKLRLLSVFTFCLAWPLLSQAQYNNIWIPDTLGGPTYNLVAKDTFMQILPGQQTITAGYNGRIWGPTLMMDAGRTVNIQFQNKLNDSTTLHWHGPLTPAVMDGGPHQIVPQGTTWRPFWTVKDKASTMWYHPHLHYATTTQVNMGLGGLIIVRDAQERALTLPRRYGQDDFPIILTDRRFGTNNQIVEAGMGDTVFTNFTLNPQLQVPAQVVRLRLLNASAERGMMVGLSGNRSFTVIASQSGLLPQSYSTTRVKLHPGQRAEILVDFSAQNGQTAELMCYNTELGPDEAGSEPDVPATPPFLRNKLGARNYSLLHLVVGPATASPVTTVPNTLAGPIAFPDTLQAAQRRNIILGFMGTPCPPSNPFCFWIDSMMYDASRVNLEVKRNDIEIWTVKSNHPIAHPFHIHGVRFKVIDVDGVPTTGVEAGWQDNVLIKGNSTVRIVTQFHDEADSLNPLMYHCHILPHEDGGMMLQFVVKNMVTALPQVGAANKLILYPNPATDKLFFKADLESWQPYYVRITDLVGRTALMLPQPQVADGIDISSLKPGKYQVAVTEAGTRKVSYHSLVITR